jgi:hypothetical protein
MSKSIYDNYFWIPFRNDSGETIPAYSSVKVTGVVSGGARTTLTVSKPDSSATMFATTGPFSVPADGYGSACVSVHRVAKFTGSIASGNRCKPKSGDWVLEEDSSGQFVCLGVIDSTKSLGLFIQDQVSSGGVKLVKAPAGGIPGRVGTLLGYATCTIWTEASSNRLIQASTDTITVFNWTTSVVCKNGDRYGIAAWCNSAWYIISEDCNDKGSTVSPGTGGGTLRPLANITQTTIYPATGTSGYRQMRFTGTGTGGGFE